MTRLRRGPRTLPILPLRDLVVFPDMRVPLIVGRQRSLAAIEAAGGAGNPLLLVAQRDPATADPTPDDLFEHGCLARIVQVLKLPDGTSKILVDGLLRARLLRVEEDAHVLRAAVAPLDEPEPADSDTLALVRAVHEAFAAYAELRGNMPSEAVQAVRNIDAPGALADRVAAQLAVKLAERQSLLANPAPAARLDQVLKILEREVQILQVERKIRSRVRKQMQRTQKEYYLNEQMQAIQQELGQKDEFRDELAELEQRIQAHPLSEEARERLDRELRKLRLMNPMSAEATVVRTYIDTVLALPWNALAEEHLDIEHAARVLDEDHYGLEKVKERVLEYLAVASLVDRMRGPILCLVGPPGVGKTSLARSVARATRRPFVRLSLGGVRDEAEIRGHRRTYIGALPGKILQSMRKAGANNPVFLLDEVDKMSADFRGDPSAALLEVLDPEQNTAFNDHYLDLDYDLSRVMFICTANSLHGIPLPLQDRLEIIRLPGYTEAEKIDIAKRFLLPRQRAANGLSDEHLSLHREALRRIVREYTREAGVRNLEREIAALCRKAARRVVAEGTDARLEVEPEHLEDLLGVPRYREAGRADHDEVGFVNGLAWTQAGGVVVPVEATSVPGGGKVILTGQLGSVFQESSQAAITYTRSRADALGLEPDFHRERDLHVHVPELWGVDGPSAGITIAVAVVSAVTGIPVRRDVAMTGEITLRGRVRPVGGLKEKLLAAHRAGLRTVLIPLDNEKDLADVPEAVQEALDVRAVRDMDEVLEIALARPANRSVSASHTPG